MFMPFEDEMEIKTPANRSKSLNRQFSSKGVRNSGNNSEKEHKKIKDSKSSFHSKLLVYFI